MSRKQGDQRQFSPQKKTVEKGKWIQNQSTHCNGRRIVLKNRHFINSTRNFFICLKMFSATSNLPQYILTSQLCVCDETDSNQKELKKNTHTMVWFFSLSEKIILRQVFIASGFQSIVLALFQFNDDAFKEKVFSLNLTKQNN